MSKEKPNRQQKDKLIGEMFEDVELDEMSQARMRKMLAPLLDAYYMNGCDEDEDDE